MTVQGQKYVIIGGAGMIGSAVADHLLTHKGVGVIICDHIGDVASHKWANLPAAIDDLWTPDSLFANLEKSWRDIAGVIMLADNDYEHHNGDALFQVAYHLPRQVWDFCVAKQRPMSWASSAHVYGVGPSKCSPDLQDVVTLKPITAFGRAKQAFDVYAARRSAGIEVPPSWVGFRLSSVYGLGEHHKGGFASLPVCAMAAARTGATLPIWHDSFNCTRDWVHVDDAAASIVAVALRKSTGFCDIGTGVNTTTAQLIADVETVTGKPLKTSLIDAPQSSEGYIPAANLTPLKEMGVAIQFRTLEQGLQDL